MGVTCLKFSWKKLSWVAVNCEICEGFLSQKFHAIYFMFISMTLYVHVDSESMLETRKQKETNWMLIGICLSVGVLLGGICVVITTLIIIIIIRKGTSSRLFTLDSCLHDM